MRAPRIVTFAALAMLCFASPAFGDPPPRGFVLHPFNAKEQQPVTSGGVTTFHLTPGLCSNVDYDDGRNETDCKNGNVRSLLALDRQFRIGESVEYRFDIRIDPAFAYGGFHNMSAEGIYPDGMDSHLRVASWESPLLRNFIYMLKVSTHTGLEFLARQCQAPEDFGQWVTFSLKVLWARDDRGWVSASCDGRRIYVDEGVATNQAPQCWPSNECEPWVPKDPSSFNFLVGPVMSGFGPDWQKIPGATSMFDELQPGGITIEVRNLSVTRGASLYDEADRARIKKLQETLASLGCDPGPADGVSGNRTRNAALTCRQFPDGLLPAKLTVATAQAFLDAYSAPGTAALPAGHDTTQKLVSSGVVVHAAEEGAMKSGRDREANSNMVAKVEGWKRGRDTISFIVVGSLDYAEGTFSELEFILQDSLGNAAPKALLDCGAPYITFPDGSVHADIHLTRVGEQFLGPREAVCVAAALPAQHAAQYKFLLSNFADIAVGMVRDKTIEAIRHEGVKLFMRRVATGEITVVAHPK